LSEHRSGDCNLVMIGKTSDDAIWCIFDGCEFGAKFRKCGDLDLFDKVREYVIKENNLFFIKGFGVAKKKIGHTPENFGAPVA